MQTESKILEPSVNSGDNPLAASFLSLPHAVYFRCADGRLSNVNEQFENFFGRKSTPHQQLQHPNILEVEAQVMASGTAISTTKVEIVESDGGFQIFEFDCMPWFSDLSEQIGTIGILRDKTDEHTKLNALAETSNLLQAVLEHLPVRVFWKDRDLVYLGCNTVFANDMGKEQPADLIGQDDYATDMTHEEADICRADDFNVLNSGEAIYGAEEVIGTGDDKLWIRVSKMPLHDASGEAIGVLGMYENIQEQKQAQIHLETALAREKELNELKTKFISTVSHEYRNPLAVISTLAGTLRHYQDKLSATQTIDKLDKIQDEVNRMTELMNDVLFIGKEDLLTSSREYEAVNMTTLCENIITSLEAEAERIRFTQVGDPQPIIGLPLHLSQAVQNLLVNSLKYSQDVVDLTLNWQGERLEVSVSDRGIGIPASAQPFIFDSFFRSKNVGLVAGNGLGLYILKRAVDLHDGDVSLASVEGKGTTFSMTLPFRPKSLG